MSGGPICQSCGHENTPDAMFCSKCGSKMESRSTDPTPAPLPGPEAAPAAGAAPLAPVQAPDSGPSHETGDRVRSRTAMAGGLADVDTEADSFATDTIATGMPVGAAAAVAQSAARPKRRVAGQAKTMLGVGRPDIEAIEAAKAAAEAKREAEHNGDGEAAQGPKDGAVEPPPRKASKASQGRTMLGMPAPDRAQVAAAVERAREKQASPPTASSAAAPSPSESARPEAALGPTTNRTMLGQPAPRREDVEAASAKPRGLESSSSSGRMRAPVTYPSDPGEEEALTLPTRKPGRGVAIAALVIGLIILAVGGGALGWAILARGPELNASVVQTDDGEVLEIEVPGAEAGARVRFGGEERELEAGRARFALSPDALTLGDNDLSVDVVDADGSVRSETVELHLEMRVRADLGPLASAPPAIEVIVEAPAGAEASLDGEALELDDSGHGSRRFEIDGSEANAEGVVVHTVRYRVRPPGGEDAQGELRTRIPLTTLQLDRPGTEVVTDQASVEFAGAVAPGATVTVGGADATVNEGRFVHRFEIAEVGEHTVDVVARAPGRAPRIQQVRIERVADLRVHAESFEFNEALTYARIAQNPATYVGQRVRFDGLVYNVDVRNGRSVVQILVQGCPEGDRCPLWVTYPAATEVENRSRVRVFGTVAGEQQFRSKSGQIRTVPRVDATFLLPTTAANRR